MGFFSKKQNLGQKWAREMPRKIPLPIKKVKEAKEIKKVEKKDTSIFGGKPYIEKRDVNAWLQSSKLFERTSIGKDRRLALGKKIFRGCRYYLNPEKARGIKDQLESGIHGSFKDLSDAERQDGIRLVEEALRK